MDNFLAEMQIRNSCSKITAFSTFIEHVFRFDFSSNMRAIPVKLKINPSCLFCSTLPEEKPSKVKLAVLNQFSSRCDTGTKKKKIKSLPFLFED